MTLPNMWKSYGCEIIEVMCICPPGLIGTRRKEETANTRCTKMKN